MLLHTGTSRRQIVRCFQGVFPVGSAIWPRTDGRVDIARGNRELRSYLRPVAERHHRHLYLLLSRKSGIRGRQKLTRQGRGSVFRIRVTVAVFHTAGLVKHQHNIGRHRGRNRGRRTIAGRSQNATHTDHRLHLRFWQCFYYSQAARWKCHRKDSGRLPQWRKTW